MTRFLFRAAAAAVLFAGPVALAADEKDDKPAEKKAATTAPDWSGYSKFSEVSGTVVKVGENGFTLRVTWYTTSTSGGNRGGGGGGMSAYNSLMHGQTPHRRSGGSRPPKVQEHHEDYDLSYAEAGMVRWHKLSQVPGVSKGGFVPPAEQTKLKTPMGAPGWAAEKDHLKEGHIVEVTLVRPKDVPLAKATPGDLKVKYAIIHGEDPNPPVMTKK